VKRSFPAAAAAAESASSNSDPDPDSDPRAENLCKVMIVSRVLAGRVFRSARNITGLVAPPPGFHSVRGVPGPVLNYDELIVYDDAAILPCYIVLYSTADDDAAK
jgi:hypothetical protein